MKSLIVLLLLASSAFAQSIPINSGPPAPVSGASSFVVGPLGPATYCYFLYAIYPIGKVGPLQPTCVTTGPNTLSSANKITISWTVPQGATGVDVLRSKTTNPPACANACALALNVTTGTVDDTGQAHSNYTYQTVGAANGTLGLNNRDFSIPLFFFTPYYLQIPGLQFLDGTQQTTAAVGGGAPVNATYLTQIPNGSLLNEQAMSLLGTGIVKNTTATGVQSIATSTDVVSTFTGCSGTQYLGADGACHPVSQTGVCQVSATVTVASCITTLTALQGGTIYFPAGTTTTIPTNINLDNLQTITLMGASDGAANLNTLGASTILFTGATGPFITAKSTTAIRLSNLVLIWNNAAATGDFLNSGHSGTAIDTSNLEIDHCYIGKTGSGAALTNLLNLNDTITSSVHDNWLAGPAAVGILGANTASDYTSIIVVGPGNTFSTATGTISSAMIRNLTSGSYVYANTFEMSTGAGSPSVMDWNLAVVASGRFTGNWVGDALASYSGNFFTEGTAIIEGFTWDSNVLVMSNTATGKIFNFSGTTAYALAINGNYTGGPIFWQSSTNINGLIMRGNHIAGGMTTAINIVSGNINGLDFSNNAGVAPGTLLSGTPASGCVESISWVTTCYGGNLALTNGTIGTTQALADNTTKVATDAFVLANIAANIISPNTSGAALGYSGLPVVTATVYVPVMGDTVGSTTAANVGWPAPSASPITGLQAYSSLVPGGGNTLVFTLYDNGAPTVVTCTMGAAAQTCSDLTHSFTPAIGDLLTWQITPTGVVVISPNIQISANWSVPVQATFYQNQSNTVANAFGTVVTQNNIRLAPFYIKDPIVVSTVAYSPTTADNTANSYDLGAYGPGCYNGAVSIPRAYHTGTTAGTTLFPSTGLKSVALAGAPITLQPGWYCFAWTSNAASPAVVFGGSTGLNWIMPYTLQTIAGGGTTLPTTITAPAISWALTGSIVVALY